MAFLVEVQVDPPFAAHIDVKWVQKVVRKVLRSARRVVQERWSGRGELTVVITDDERVRELNRRYRGVDLPTDVLAFGDMAEEFVKAPDVPSYLGDVVISYPRARAQADEQGHSPEGELALLVIHGTLHLLGYDHTTPEEEAVMWARQEAILRRVG